MPIEEGHGRGREAPDEETDGGAAASCFCLWQRKDVAYATAVNYKPYSQFVIDKRGWWCHRWRARCVPWNCCEAFGPKEPSFLQWPWWDDEGTRQVSEHVKLVSQCLLTLDSLGLNSMLHMTTGAFIGQKALFGKCAWKSLKNKCGTPRTTKHRLPKETESMLKKLRKVRLKQIITINSSVLSFEGFS